MIKEVLHNGIYEYFNLGTIVATIMLIIAVLGYIGNNWKELEKELKKRFKRKTDSKKIKKIAKEKKVNFFYPDKETVTISINETTAVRDVNYIISVFAEAAKKDTLQRLLSDEAKWKKVREDSEEAWFEAQEELEEAKALLE